MDAIRFFCEFDGEFYQSLAAAVFQSNNFPFLPISLDRGQKHKDAPRLEKHLTHTAIAAEGRKQSNKKKK